MKKIIIHTPHDNVALVENALRQVGFFDFDSSCQLDDEYTGYHLGNPNECVVVETTETLHIEALKVLQAFGKVEIVNLGIDTTLN